MSNARMLVFGLFFLSTGAFSKADPSPHQSRKLITLLTQDMVEVFNRSIEIDQLCLPTLKADKLKACKEKALAPDIWSLDLHKEPSTQSPRVGRLILAITPGQQVDAKFKPEKGKEIPFHPDQHDSDYGYGPHYNQTVLKWSGTWIQLPKRPFPQPVWLNVAAPKGKGLGLSTARAGDILQAAVATEKIYNLGMEVSATASGKKVKETFPAGSSIVILDIKGNRVRFRLETDADMACGEEVEPEKSKPIEYIAELKDFYDVDEHVVVSTKYTRGC